MSKTIALNASGNCFRHAKPCQAGNSVWSVIRWKNPTSDTATTEQVSIRVDLWTTFAERHGILEWYNDPRERVGP